MTNYNKYGNNKYKTKAEREYEKNEQAEEVLDEVVETEEVEEPEKETIKQKLAKVVCDALNFRSDIDGDILRVLFKGDEVEVINENGEWLEVSHNGDTGYVMKKFVK